ncbi:site-2 protease family protein [Methylocystis bryophila]|uniref:Zinc metalloprotease n=1 Tax=Methylocystis bryophila TaxID=655015 RepID=A0A1W6MXI2_9HYPH|nr:site-2 protease family protein [Methylocystis bryophila]ARN82305.1 site-2 protease family protein [Methylocystis bryophila]BDV38456.1 protease [Methylocystis bryophila]
MGWSVTIGRFFGTYVRIHITFLIFLAWIGFSAYQRAGIEAAKQSVVFIVAIFACVVLHEFGHILTARRYGVRSTQVTLLPIGGVADLDKMPEKPYQELLIALAGPLVNLVIAAILLVIAGAMDGEILRRIDDPSIGLVEKLAATNVFLAVFNMVPAFPMDGGRVLRAALSMWLGKQRATMIAAQIGQAFAFALGFLGLFGNPILIFIAFFVYFAAAAEAQNSFVQQATHEVRVVDVMETRVVSISRGATVGEAVDILLATSRESFPVLNASGGLIGLLSRDDIVEAVRDGDTNAPVAPFAHKEIATITPEQTLDAALEQLVDAPAVGVVAADGRLLGLVTKQSVAEVMLIKAARPDWQFSRGGRVG